MPWALLWKFRAYIGIILVLLSIIGVFVHLMNAHDERVAAEAVHKERVAALNDQLGITDRLVASYDLLIDSLKAEVKAREPKKVEVREHTQKLAKIQIVEQSAIDSFLAVVRDSAIKVVVDSVDLKYRALVINMGEQVVSANAIKDMAESDSKNKDDIMHDQDVQIASLKRMNLDLVKELNLPVVKVTKHESVGHFIAHKILPLGLISGGAVLLIEVAK